jgi:hypothetical protein
MAILTREINVYVILKICFDLNTYIYGCSEAMDGYLTKTQAFRE